MSDARFDLTGRVAVITGGAGLLGLSHARAIHAAGGIPVLLDIAAPAPNILRERAGFEVGWSRCDITREEELRQTLADILALHGRLDILINNAANNPKVETQGALDRTRLENFPLADWHADLAVGLTGAMLCSRVFGAEMARRGKGVIVNVASIAGKRVTVGGGVAYTIAKQGVITLTESLNMAEFRNGIRACAISPGEVATPIMQKRADPPPPEVLAKMLKPEDVARAIRFAVEMPPHACVYEIVVAPTWNRGFL